MNERKRKRLQRAEERHRILKEKRAERQRLEEKKAERKRKKKAAGINIVQLFIIIIVLGIAVFVGVRAVTTYRIMSDYKKVQEENQRLKAEKKSLEEELKHVNEPEYVEQQARQQLKMVKPGETMYILPKEEQKNKSSGDV